MVPNTHAHTHTQTSSTSSSSMPATRAPSPSPTLAHADGEGERAPKVSTSSTPEAPLPVSVEKKEEIFLGGTGSMEDPLVVGWAEGEVEDPYNWSYSKKWCITGLVALNTLCIAFASSAYSGGVNQIAADLKVTSEEIMILGISLYVLGFGAGPLIWAPLSEMYGRRIIFIVSYLPFTLFQIGGACANNIETILITRAFAGFFGSAPLTNSGGQIADMWSAQERGLASALFALAPFLGPVLGPIVGGFTAASGWRNVFWVMFAFAAVTYIITLFSVPETYAPKLLRHKCDRLHKASGGTVYYISKFEKANTLTKKQMFKLNMTRPFVLLFKEPIVLLLSIYTAIVYGTLYLFFCAFPIVFQRTRGWSSGIGGLAFLGVGGGMLLGTAMAPLNNKYYMAQMAKSPTGRAPPEARLPFACIGSIMLPVGIFWFAWTSDPSIHWIAPILAGVPFGCGMLLVFTSVIGYLIDTYLMYAASALAANAVMRSILGAIFPLFSTYMYKNLGNEWASTLVGFLSLVCVPMPFVFFFYGEKIRGMSSFSPTGKPAPPPSPTAGPNEKAPIGHDLEAVMSRHTVNELERQFSNDAGMEEQRFQDLALERKKSSHNIV